MKNPFVIGICGGTGSGKTTLAKTLKESFPEDVLLLCQDYYYRAHDELDYDQRCQINYDHPDAFDTDLMIQQIRMLKNSQNIQRPIYSFVKYNREKETIEEHPRKVIVVEGILLFLNPELMDLMDMKVFVDTDGDIRFARRLMRDINERGRSVDSVINQYLSTVKPMHDAFVEPSKRHADIIIPEGGMNKVAVSILLGQVRSILKTEEW